MTDAQLDQALRDLVHRAALTGHTLDLTLTVTRRVNYNLSKTVGRAHYPLRVHSAAELLRYLERIEREDAHCDTLLDTLVTWDEVAGSLLKE